MMIEFYAWEAKARPIRMAIKLGLVLLPIALLIALVPFLFFHHVAIPRRLAGHDIHVERAP